MTLLSITFHSTPSALENWQSYVDDELKGLIGNFMDVDQYILSEVDTDMIRSEEGRNYNLLLFFDDEDKRDGFLDQELKILAEKIQSQFGESVMIFDTLLNPLYESKSGN